MKEECKARSIVDGWRCCLDEGHADEHMTAGGYRFKGRRKEPKVERIVLKTYKDRVDDPSCYRSDGTACGIYGPGVVERITWPDGGITLKIIEGCKR